MITLSIHATVFEAEMVRSVLADAGIEAFILNPHAHELYPGVLGGVELQVMEHELEEAKKFLEKFNADNDSNSDWDDT
ncbi:MAG: DUF2007 domain-containing protein [bacterium]|nr:DUF2007 domain-containing protein [bacterium]